MEVEIRAKINNKGIIESKLKELGAELKGTKELKDYYFGDLKLYEKIGHSFWIRLRVKGNKITLAYKGPTETDGIYEEYEQEMQDEKTALQIISKIGLDNPITINKTRTSYQLANINIEIDDIEGKGTYLELETISEDVDKTLLREFLDKLGIPPENRFEKGFITIFLQETNSPFSKWIKN